VNGARSTFVVSGVCCATEEAVLRKRLDGAIGAAAYRFNVVTCELPVAGDVDSRKVETLVRQAGFQAREKRALVPEQGFVQRHREALLTGGATGLFLLGAAGNIGMPMTMLVYLLAILLGGWKILWKAFAALRTGVLDMNVLMTTAVVGAAAIGKWSEGAAVVILFSVALMLESYSTARTRKAVQSLLSLSPQQASVLRDGQEQTVDASAVVPGDVIVIRPGERVPLDGTVVEGSSTVNESAVTGESTPVAKTKASELFAGSINDRGMLRATVSRHHDDTALARILQLIEDAEQQRAPVQDFIDRFARIYTPAVLALALLVAAIPPLVLSQPPLEWVYRALVLLVIACPCALVISTPVTIVSALTNAARRGVLIKGGRHIEHLSRINAVAFDKTGTLTEGRPRLTDIVVLNALSRDRVLQIAAALEYRSEHHLAEAILDEAARSGVDHSSIEVSEFESLPGRGVRAVVEGRTFFLGNDRLGREEGYLDADALRRVGDFVQQGKTPMILGSGGETISILAVQDSTRHHSKAAIERLRDLGIKHFRLLSGDQEHAVDALAGALSIDRAAGRLLPAEKVSAVQEMMEQYGTVAMVGDGVNDAPALAVSTVGIAMGVAGSDAALETADVVLMSDDLAKLPYVFALSSKAMTIIRQNIALALGVKSVFLVLSLAGFSTLWMALLADDGAALAVILNGLRILRFEEF
jgi:Zn2+/Cd2+-exporting ATPase